MLSLSWASNPQTKPTFWFVSLYHSFSLFNNVRIAFFSFPMEILVTDQSLTKHHYTCPFPPEGSNNTNTGNNFNFSKCFYRSLSIPSSLPNKFKRKCQVQSIYHRYICDVYQLDINFATLFYFMSGISLYEFPQKRKGIFLLQYPTYFLSHTYHNM